MSSEILKEELETFDKNKSELLATAKGQWVLIKADKILGTFHSMEDAIKEGYKTVGNMPFLVKQILEIEENLSFTSNLLAV